MVLVLIRFQHLSSDVGWCAKSQKSSNDDFRRLLLYLVVLMYEFRGKTPQSGCETRCYVLGRIGR